MRGRFGLFGALFALVLILIVGGIGYAIGASTGPVEVVQAAPGTVPYGYGYGFGHPFGWVFGLVFFFLIFGLLFAAIGRRRWSGGPGGWGRGWGGPGKPGWGGPGWGGPGWGARFDPNDPHAADWLRDVPPAFRPMLESWHRQAHGEGPTAAGPASGPTTGPTMGATGSDAPLPAR